MLRTGLFKKLVKVTVTLERNATLSHPKMHAYIKFGLPIKE